MTWPARALRLAVRLYQLLNQLVRAGRPSPCRYFPSCSEYAMEALQVHGPLRGTWLSARRLSRCHPWGGHGVDLVPLPEELGRKKPQAPQAGSGHYRTAERPRVRI
jgi:putative membrane protein insertion efficiency factor